MFIVTGGAGFIGSNLVRALNARGIDEILVVDDLADGHKFANLADARIADYLDRDDFRERVREGADFGRIEAVFHQGACTDTTEWDGQYMLDTNFATSKELSAGCQARRGPPVYAPWAAVFGAATRFSEDDDDLRPLNVYGWSKLLFDRWVARRRGDLTARVVGFRYFNVYGPGEAHKKRMASVIHHFDRQLRETGKVRLFGASHGCGDGEHRRDFVFVGDIAAANLWAFESDADGVFNLGTGQSRTFNDVARAVIAIHGGGRIEYIPMPDDLVSAYQANTEADLTRLRAAGFAGAFTSIEDGVRRTLAGD